MAESINQRLAKLADKADAKELRALLNAVLVDNAALRTSITAVTAKLDLLTAKLNADAGVTDTDYATNFASTCDPAALTLAS